MAKKLKAVERRIALLRKRGASEDEVIDVMDKAERMRTLMTGMERDLSVGRVERAKKRVVALPKVIRNVRERYKNITIKKPGKPIKLSEEEARKLVKQIKQRRELRKLKEMNLKKPTPIEAIRIKRIRRLNESNLIGVKPEELQRLREIRNTFRTREHEGEKMPEEPIGRIRTQEV